MELLKLYVLFVTVIGLSGADVIVQVENGQVRGRESISVESGNQFYSFRGIPYAQPPVGDLRFEPPQPVQNWAGVWDATEDRPHCVQDVEPVRGSEDCLFVNVYTPQRPDQQCELLPVLVWYYVGGFTGGESNYETYGPDHYLDRDVVVVTLNYRLGIFGFLSTGDLTAPGNAGLKDQVLALKWVNKNIRNFCGDPNQITIAGSSAGGASVAYLLQSPLAKGLYQGAILQSGTSLSLWSYCRHVPEITGLIAQEFGIDTSSPRSIVDGLKQLNADDLQTVSSSVSSGAFMSYNPRDGFIIGPVSEPEHPGAFFTGKSHDHLVNGEFEQVPLLIGYNSLEGTFFQLDGALRLLLLTFDLNPDRLVPIDMNVLDSLKLELGRKVKQHYFGFLPIALSNVQLMKFLSDDQFGRGVIEFARQTSKRTPTYLYRFSYEGGLAGFHNRTTPGVAHGEELSYQWRTPNAPLTQHDFVVKERVLTLWTNFIKYRNPTPSRDPLLENKIWTPVGSKIEFLEIAHSLTESEFPDKDNVAFWDDLYARYGNPPHDTY